MINLTTDKTRRSKAFRYLETAESQAEGILEYKNKIRSRTNSVLFYLRNAKTFMQEQEVKVVKKDKKIEAKFKNGIEVYR